MASSGSAPRTTATPYHRQARETPAYGWWKLPVAGLVIVTVYLILSVLVVVAAAAYFAAVDGSSSLDGWLDSVGELDPSRPAYFVLDMLGLVVLIPSVLLGVLAVGPRPVGYLSSVAGRLRWRWLARTSLIAVAVYLVTIGASLAITEQTDPADLSAPSTVTTSMVVALALVVLVVPFQAAAEEYLFRGYLMQLVGTWSRFAFLPVIISTPLFVAGHGYDLWGLLDVAIFGLTAAVLTIRTGGLEAAIAAHAANNVILFALDALGVIVASDDSGASAVDLVPTAVASVLMIVLVEWQVRRLGIQRTREPMPEPPGPLMPMWPPPPYQLIWYPPAVPSADGIPDHWPSEGSERRLAPGRSPAAATKEPLKSRSDALHPDTPDYPGELPPDWRR